MVKAWRILLVASLAMALLTKPGIAQGTSLGDPTVRAVQPADLCTEAARTAEKRHNLPAGLLLAIGQVESGRPVSGQWRIKPWPWTVQAEDKSFFFDSKPQAVRWTMDAMSRGISSIDTGCLQVNLFFHPTAFQTIDDAFDPGRNADYAARFLLRLYAATGDWRTAAGYYHSQTAALAVPYENQVARRLNEAGTGWMASPGPATLLSQVATAWHDTTTFSRSGPPLPSGNDWSALPHSVDRTAASSLLRPPLPHGPTGQRSIRQPG